MPEAIFTMLAYMAGIFQLIIALIVYWGESNEA